MNILVTGANGQLGNEMRLCSLYDKVNKYVFTDITTNDNFPTEHLDITKIDEVRYMVLKNNINCIVNCAAWTNVDGCETNNDMADIAKKINTDAPYNLGIVMKEVDGLLIHISTDYVFGKEPYNTPCTPNQVGTPTGVYGKTKLEGEKNIIKSGCNYVIIRTAWLYSVFGKNFCKTMFNLTKTKEELNVVFDQCGTPTYANDLATSIIHVIKTIQDSDDKIKYYGIYHYSNEGVTSWYDFTKMIAKISEHNKCKIIPCRSDLYPSPVIRPSYSVLDKELFKKIFNIEIPYWVDSLERCINILKNQV